MIDLPTPVLVDRRNIHEWHDRILAQVKESDLIGIDCETEDSGRHPGLESYNNKTRHVFDINRTVMTGFSLWPEGGEHSYYFNLSHADVENRISFDEVVDILDAKPDHAYWLAHNAPFELVMFKQCHDYDLTNVICSLQLCVTAYGPDKYSREAFVGAGLGGIKKLLPEIADAFGRWDGKSDLTPEQYSVLGKITGKQSTSEWSYNGFINDITWGYNLKKAVKSWFGYQMTTYEEVLGDKEHMGQLTGEEVVSYGADDAIWTVRLFRQVMDYLLKTNPDVIQTFFQQENPMIYAYADAWRSGVRVNFPAIEARTTEERHEYAELSRNLRTMLRQMLPFPEEPQPTLTKIESWYAKNWKKKRQEIVDWVMQDNVANDFEQVTQFSNAIGNAWAGEKSAGVSLGHYMPLRVIYYDLFGDKPIVVKGKVQSDADTRGKLIERLDVANDNRAPLKKEIIETLGKMASVETRMKLYLTPYSQLTDPDTGRLYPVLSSMLATRRMATKYPSPMQLAKRGESTYVRGFFLAG